MNFVRYWSHMSIRTTVRNYMQIFWQFINTKEKEKEKKKLKSKTTYVFAW